MTMVKISSLNRFELASFVKLDGGLFVLGKKLQSYDWDSGSIWKLMKTPEGELVIARQTEAKVVDPSSGIFDASCKCGNELTTLELNGSRIAVCSRCNPELASFQKTASKEVITENSPSGISSIDLTVEGSKILHSNVLPLLQSWVEGMVDITAEAILERAIAEKEKGFVDNATAAFISDHIPLVVHYAVQYKNSPALFEHEFAEENYDPNLKQRVSNGESLAVNRKISSLLSRKPSNMSTEVFTRLYATIKN